jgi:ATP adenylyltransferase
MMNLFPYNTGHLMLVPVAHVATPEEAEPAALAEVATLLAPVMRALRRVLRCDGFNVGMNVGAVAGAGVADHLHQHVVPRWEGDANFMPILASTMVLPELIPVTYAKARAELARESGAAATLVVLDADRRRVLAVGDDGGRRLPEVGPGAGEPVWRAAVRTATELTGAPAEVLGWAGERRVVPGERPALTVALSARAADGDRALWLPLEAALAGSDNGRDHRTVAAALANLAPGDGG